MKTIKINGKDYQFKYSIRALFIWEKIMDKSFELKTLMDNYVFFYSMILANNSEVLEWDDFINALDNDPSLLTELANTLKEQQNLNRMEGDSDNKEEKKS